MLSLKKNPFSWSEENNITGTVGSVSLTRGNGSVIPIENLSEEIEVRVLQTPSYSMSFESVTTLLLP